TQIADAAKLKASSASTSAGEINASENPTKEGSKVSIAVWAPQTAAFARATRSRPTSTGRAPKLAPSKKVAMAGPRKATTNSCGTVRTPAQCAMGTEAITAA